jgi:peptide/nickel transport system permease protein
VSSRHAWLARRALLALVTLVLVSVVVFAATQALPGDAAHSILGPDATPARVAALRDRLGLDRPLAEQYAHWLGGSVQGDFGRSIVSDERVSSLLAAPLLNSAVLVLLAALIVIPLVFVVASLAGLRPGGVVDRSIELGSLVFVGIPEFVIGLVLVTLFATTVWKILPAVALIPPGDSPLSHPAEMVLPVCTLVLVCIPYLARLLGAAMADALDSPYAELARLRGVPEHRVIVRHVLPNALVPAIQGAALTLAYLAGGIVVVEYLFGYPGLGSALVDAVSTRDLPTVQAVALILAAFYVVVNLAADVLTHTVSPRLRTAGR